MHGLTAERARERRSAGTPARRGEGTSFASARRTRVLAALAIVLAPAPALARHELALAARAPAAAAERASLFDRVVRVLSDDLYPAIDARRRLPETVARLRERARASATGHEDRALVQELLASLGVSHLALFSAASYRAMQAELAEQPLPTLGLQLVAIDGRFHADWIYEDGPADVAGVRRGEEVSAIDGRAPAESPRLDWRTDDAALPDPPLHALLCRAGERVELTLRDVAGGTRTVALRAREYGGAQAMRASARILADGERRYGYVHLWFLSSPTPASLLEELIADGFRDCDALIVDLRGRGGFAGEAERIARLLDARRGAWNKPLVVLVHGQTRSAKEVLAWRLQASESALVVGEHTAGAVVPASFEDVGGGAVLMYPAFSLGALTEQLEGKGVAPDVPVAAPLAGADGDDPILDAGVIAARTWCETLEEERASSAR